ncbi:hypothetical protein CAPTEDRAFT_170310 [Capitella teleta]|uniref:peptidylamidoglycolate lyase n=1 Tax=Capitella teleta TaxID=283909 RepID=R7U264_CAPTE|nr:hypothetical protein CAPTEDRAFT_170310 [Capitella teleta]|eukprot:ELT97260.1 hypothetical protein CAPTEDRAFT_170310 [Capitella teleta]
MDPRIADPLGYRDDDDTRVTLDDDEMDECNGHLEVVEGWPKEDLHLGQIGGVAVCKDGHPVVFHRSQRVFDENSFFANNSFAKIAEGPIEEPALLRLNKTDGSVLNQWGDALFYLPHGLSIDHENNFWMTDVAMHQVFKFKEGSSTPLLTLGKAFEPATSNKDTERFCQPADVAVASNGDIYVADGYCNSRIVRFDKDGNYMESIGEGQFWIPHSIALAENLGLLCIADRNNMTIQCLDMEGRPNKDVIFNDDKLGMVYALSYVPEEGKLYAIMGNTGDLEAKGLTIDLAENNNCESDLLGTWSPNDQPFSAPHDMCSSPSGDAVYVGEIGPNNIWKFVRG